MKKVISVFLALALVFLMSACKKSNDKSAKITQAENAAETTTETTTQAEPEDPLAIYEVNEGNYFCLYRNNKLYTLANKIPNENAEKFKMGYKIDFLDDDYTSIYYDGVTLNNNSNNSDSLGKAVIAFGDFPLIEIKPDDSIRGYGKTTLFLYKAAFYGYSLTISYNHEGPTEAGWYKYYIYTPENKEDPYVTSELSITDLSGNKVEDYHNLKYNEDYLVSWYDGTEYNEFTLKANNPCYSYDSDIQWQNDNFLYSIEGTLTKNGYATFDLSDIPSGIYRIDDASGTFIKIP